MNAKSKVFESLGKVKLATVDAAAGYVINEKGDRSKITEAMIKLACHELKTRCHLPAKSKS